jgi:hypothetical protein
MGRKLGKRRRKVSLAEAPLISDRRGPVDRRAEHAHRQATLVPVEVPDPYEPGATVIAFKNAKGDPLERLRQQSDIDEAQYQAGKAYERDMELAEIGNVKAVDPTKEAVDGGRLPEAVTEPQRKAMERLREAARVMGLFAESVVRGVLERNVSPAQLAIARGFSTRREQLHYGWIFRRALEELTLVYQTAGRARV